MNVSMLRPSKCPLCSATGEFLINSGSINDHDATIIMPTKTLKAKSKRNSSTFTLLTIFLNLVYSVCCTNCKVFVAFDGQSVCLLNMGKYLVCYEMLRNFLFQFASVVCV